MGMDILLQKSFYFGGLGGLPVQSPQNYTHLAQDCKEGTSFLFWLTPFLLFHFLLAHVKKTKRNNHKSMQIIYKAKSNLKMKN